jgi:hypothetical protein
LVVKPPEDLAWRLPDAYRVGTYERCPRACIDRITAVLYSSALDALDELERMAVELSGRSADIRPVPPNHPAQVRIPLKVTAVSDRT